MRWLSVCAFLNACTWSVSSTAQTGLGMQLAPSRAHLLAMMSALVSVSAVLQFVLLPVAGKVSDTFGRKAMMLFRSAIMCVFPATLALRPSYAVFCAQRLMTNMTWSLDKAAVDAMLADMFESEALASASARVMSQSGAAMLLLPMIGGRLAERSFSLCYGCSSIFSLLKGLVEIFCLQETKGLGLRKQESSAKDVGWAAAINPFGFLRLFRSGRELACLALASAISDFADGTYEIDRHFGIDVAGMTMTQDGMHASLRGASTVVGGRLVGPVVACMTNMRFTLVCNLLGLCYFGVKANARTPIVYMAAQLPYTLGSGRYRSAVVDAQVVKHALRARMKEGETAAAQANAKAVGMVIAPQIYSRLFMAFRETVPGAPYYFCMGLMLVQQALIWAAGVDAMGDVPPAVLRQQKALMEKAARWKQLDEERRGKG